MPDQFPSVSISGGPHGRNVEMRKDGERMKGVTRFELTGDSNDVVRLKTFQIVRVIADLRVDSHVHAVTARVLIPADPIPESQFVSDPIGEQVVAEATADTLWEALRDCSRQLELAAKGSVEYTET